MLIQGNGFDVLKEYEGAAAIIIRDDRHPDTLFVFKGASKTYTKVEEERPLFYYQEDVNSLWISSRSDGLYLIGGDFDTVESFESNMLYIIVRGVISSKTLYDRSECFSYKKSYTTYGSGKTYPRGGYHGRDMEDWGNDYRLYEDYYENLYGGGLTPPKSLPPAKPVKMRIQDEPIIDYKSGSMLQFTKLRYFRTLNGKQVLVNGPLNINRFGAIVTGKQIGRAHV